MFHIKNKIRGGEKIVAGDDPNDPLVNRNSVPRQKQKKKRGEKTRKRNGPPSGHQALSRSPALFPSPFLLSLHELRTAGRGERKKAGGEREKKSRVKWKTHTHTQAIEKERGEQERVTGEIDGGGTVRLA